MTATLPLRRFRVLDLTRMRSGPTAVRQFADWGAQVIMVEPKEGAGEVSGGRHGSDFQNLNRNKRSIALDLKSDAGRAVFYRLVKDCDVLVENFRPDVKTRLKIDYETLRSINPRLVYVSISGFGQDGPYSGRPGLDQVIQGMSGLMSITGAPGHGPMRAGIAVTDSVTGLYAALGAMTALLEREITGQGRWVRTSLIQSAIALLDFQAARWLVEGEVPEQAGNDHPTATPMGLFETSDGFINLAVIGDAKFRRLCEVMGKEDFARDPRFVGDLRVKHREFLNTELGAVFRSRPSAHWVDVVNAIGIPCGPVYRIDQALADPNIERLKMARPVCHPVAGTMHLVGQPLEISGFDPALRDAAPDAGQHTRDILDELGYGDCEIEALAKEEAVFFS